jgi:mannose-6-phosphate isomerase class I
MQYRKTLRKKTGVFLLILTEKNYIIVHKEVAVCSRCFCVHFMMKKPWGGQKLNELFGRKLPYELTGESWEASALPQGESVVYGGKYDGMPLSQLYERRSRLFCGRGGRFPLLIKYIDANSTLSVQVHPNHATSLEYEESQRERGGVGGHFR